MTESQQIVEIARVLIARGVVYSGGDPQIAERIAAEWYDHDFDADETDEWCSVGCWTASVAAEFQDAYMTPRVAARACEAFERKYGPSRGVDAMYAVCNADLPTEDVIAEYVAS